MLEYFSLKGSKRILDEEIYICHVSGFQPLNQGCNSYFMEVIWSGWPLLGQDTSGFSMFSGIYKKVRLIWNWLNHTNTLEGLWRCTRLKFCVTPINPFQPNLPSLFPQKTANQKNPTATVLLKCLCDLT